MGNKKKHSDKSKDKHRHKKKKNRDRESSISELDSDHPTRSAKRNYRSRSRSPVKSKRSRSQSDSRKRDSYKSSSKTSHKRKKHETSSDSSSDSDYDGGSSRVRNIEKEKIETILKSKEERKKEKEMMKTLETPEEKRARRLAKKEAKERRRKEKMGWDKDYLGYTNSDNPFGDECLLDTFVWSKKMEKEGKKHLNEEEIHKHQKMKLEESRRELEKVKKRRLERERQMEERDNERELMQREKESEYYREWEKQEDNFHLNQAKLRSKIRIQDGRAKPIDLLAKYISVEEDDLAVEMHEPYTYLYGLTIVDLEDLLEDIKVYLELEQGKNVEYWRDIITIANDELGLLRKLDSSQRDFQDRRERINESVSNEVQSIFKGKTTNQLLLLEEQIRKKLQGGEGVDVGYWESLLQQLKAHMARTRLRERHQENLKQKLFKLKQEQGIDSGPLFPAGVSHGSSNNSTPDRRNSPIPSSLSRLSPAPSKSKPQSPAPSGSRENQPSPGPSTSAIETEEEDEPEPGPSTEAGEEDEEALITEEDLEDQAYIDYDAGSYSPKLLRNADLEIDTVVYDPIDDMRKLELARQQVLSTGRVRLDGETEFEKKAREGMNDDEATFSVEVPTEHQKFLWSDKYRPRKPRFFNRVHTGFEWNKYNQTHYDIDNPPPKIVQGYKFNIFYPDLIDKTDTPEYTLTPLEDNKDFAVLKFHAGPPYEDIAFKIVHREWEYSYKHGFRCQFQNNIFQLWFHFKRYRYRR
ncbi:splicing factor Cactin-like [Ostrea edulis]|uniref:splicing factor Cactin-like n=1 Tax=Ostrea edulis TaxID=37623 RepID=UPI00209607B2|nr:splicing factor Cactin-like [Ostrea edulis]